jgi:GNAT superfamily N-acetyltransferase
LAPRAAFVGIDDGLVAGFIAGHLTERFGCAGELEWISIRPQYRRRGVASGLLRLIAGWFRDQGAGRICVDVAPSAVDARAFYSAPGAVELKPHWMIWEDIRKLA